MNIRELLKWVLLLWMGVVIWAAFLYVPPAEKFIGESSRIVFFHVPTAWVAVLAFLISCVASVLYLRRREPGDDIRAAVAAGLGLLFAILATVTGAVFARIMWGAYWNWDPRQTSIVILMLIYASYFALRGAIPDPERRAKYFPRFGRAEVRWPHRVSQSMETRIVDPESGAEILETGRPGELQVRGASVFDGPQYSSLPSPSASKPASAGSLGLILSKAALTDSTTPFGVSFRTTMGTVGVGSVTRMNLIPCDWY